MQKYNRLLLEREFMMSPTVDAKEWRSIDKREKMSDRVKRKISPRTAKKSEKQEMMLQGAFEKVIMSEYEDKAKFIVNRLLTMKGKILDIAMTDLELMQKTGTAKAGDVEKRYKIMKSELGEPVNITTMQHSMVGSVEEKELTEDEQAMVDALVITMPGQLGLEQ